MNRLWVYLSLTFTTVIILAMVGIMVTIRLTSGIDLDPNTPPPPEVVEYLNDQGIRPFTPDVTLIAVTIGVIAIGAGVWMSRRLTKPLSELEEAAIAIGQQDLTRRVPIHGSQEFLAVASSFNNMAALLEQEESLRRNLLADVAHELRHPIHILQGNLQAILDDIYPLTKDEIDKLVQQTNHLSVLVNDLHILAQAEAHQLPLSKQGINIADLVKELATSYSSLAAAKNISLRVQLLGTIPDSTDLDKDRMRQAINNLLDNAFRHTPDGGTIVVSIEQSDPHLLITVSDTGEGIDAEKLPYVFERFYRIDKARDRSATSTGLGLAIVKVIIEAHDGSVLVSSPGIGQGSTVTISLNNQE
jgi:two-component system sensor histidine kinase BaeS